MACPADSTSQNHHLSWGFPTGAGSLRGHGRRLDIGQPGRGVGTGRPTAERLLPEQGAMKYVIDYQIRGGGLTHDQNLVNQGGLLKAFEPLFLVRIVRVP
jgi:hypothetical protein